MHGIFLSYEFDGDARIADAVRSVWLARGGRVTLESAKASSDREIKQWIDQALGNAAVTVVLVGQNTASSRWVNYEIQHSKSLGKGLLGIDIRGMSEGAVNGPASPIPMLSGYPVYDWVKDDGEAKLGLWVSEAIASAQKASKRRGDSAST